MSKPISQLQACESLIREHRHMETLLDALNPSLNSLADGHAETLTELQTQMRRIEAEMNTHFACEEKVLFPAVSPYHPMVLMEVEHEELIAQRDGLLALLDQATVSSEECAQIREIGQRFISEMLDHIGREDAGIFPTCERALSDAEKSEVITGMERIRREAAVQPTPSISRPERTFEVMQAQLDRIIERPIFSERLLDSPVLEIKHLILQGGQALPAHWSPKQITLICLKGEGIFTANQQDVPLQPGACITLAPQLSHGIQAQTDCHLLLLLH